MEHLVTSGIFPLIRKLSRPCIAVFSRLPVTPDQITALSLFNGLGGSISYLPGIFMNEENTSKLQYVNSAGFLFHSVDVNVTGL